MTQEELELVISAETHPEHQAKFQLELNKWTTFDYSELKPTPLPYYNHYKTQIKNKVEEIMVVDSRLANNTELYTAAYYYGQVNGWCCDGSEVVHILYINELKCKIFYKFNFAPRAQKTVIVTFEELMKAKRPNYSENFL